MYIIGLTGNIGTGKSTVGRLLEELGARYIDADEVAHQVTRRGTVVYDAVVADFGQEILGPDGEIDRRRLGPIVFADAARMRRLEELTHPAVLERLGQLVVESPAPVVVLDAVKLIESGLAGFCSAVWVVTAPEAAQVSRLMRTRGMTREEALLRIRSQPPQEEKVRRADVLIDNASNLDDLRRQVAAAWWETQSELT